MDSLTQDEIQSLLSAKDRWIVLTTLDADGYPHSVPMGYFLVGRKVVLGCKDGTQKVVNAERDSRCSLLWENGRGSEELIGVLFRGEVRVVRKTSERLALKREACRQRGEAEPDEISDGFVYLEITPKKTTSWRRPTGRRRS